MEINDYTLELEKAAAQINKQKARRVLIQLPDGLKPLAMQIVDELKAKTKSEIFIWFRSCFGACDAPVGIDKDIDLLIQFGHSAWK